MPKTEAEKHVATIIDVIKSARSLQQAGKSEEDIGGLLMAPVAALVTAFFANQERIAVALEQIANPPIVLMEKKKKIPNAKNS